MPFTDYVRNSLARPVLLEVLAFSLLAFSFSSRGHWNAFSLRLTLAHLHRFITAGPAGGQNEEAQVEELVQRLETLVRNAPEDDERRPHLERALDSLQSLHSRSPQPDGPPSPVSTHGACLSPRMLGLGPLLHSSNTPLSSPLRRPMSPMSPLALSLPALALDRAVPEPHPADVQQSQPHGLLLNLSDPALDDARPTSNAVAEPDAPSTPVQQQARAGLPAAEPHLDDPAFFFRALLLSPRHQRPAAQPRTATTPSRRERDERPVLPLLRERALSAPNLATLPALGLNLHLDVPPSPSMPLPAAPEPYSDDEGEQPAPIALAVDTLPTPSLALPAAPASPCSDDERDVLAPLPSDRRPPLPPVDTAAPPPEAYEDLVSPITFAPAPLSPVREMSPVRFAPPSPSVAALPRADERDWPAFPAVQPQELESPAQVEAEAAPAATVVSDEQPPFEQATPSPIAAAAIPLPEDRVEPESAEVPSPLPGAIQEEEPSEPEHTATPLLLTVHEPLEEDSDSEEGVILDVVPVLPLQVEDTPTAAHAAESQAPAPEPESTQEEEEEEEEEDEQQEELPVVEIPLVIAPSPLLIPALLDEDAITPVSLTPEPTALLVSPKADAVDVPLPPSRPSSALQQIEDDITRSMTFEERNAETTSQPADESEQSGYFNQSHSQSASLSVSTAADGDESPVSTGASSPLTRDNLRQLNLSNGGPRASVSGGSLAWTAQSSAVDALEAALHKLRTMRSSGSLASRSGGSASASASASPSPLRTQFGQPATGASTPSPLRSNFAPALPPPIEDDVSPTFSQFSFTTESPTEDEHMDPEPASSDGLEEALSVPLPKPKRKASKTLLDVPSATPARRRASHLDVPPATSTPLRRASHLDFPRSAILQDDESVSGDDDASEVAPLSLDQILDEVFPSASPEVHPVPSRTIERVPSFDFDFHRAGDGEDSQEDRAHWRDSIRFPGAEGGSRDSLPGPSRGRTKSGRFVRRVLSRLHLGRESAEANASTVSLAPSTPPRSPASSVASSTAQRTHTRRSSKSSGKEPKTQRSRTVSLFSTLSSRRTAMTTPEPVPPVPQAGPSDDTARSRAMSLFASGLGMPAREHGAVEGRRRSMSLFKRGGGKKKRGETAGAEVDVEEPPVPAMPPMPHSHSAPAGEMTVTPGKGRRRDRTLSVFSTLSSRSLVGRYDNAAADEFGTLVGTSDGRPQKSRPGSSASSGKHAPHHHPEGTVSWAELIKPHPHPRARSSSPSSSRGRSMSPARRPSGERRMSISNIAKHPPSYVEPHRPPLAVLSSSVRRRTMSAGTVDARRSVSWAGAPRTPPKTHKRARTMSATGPPPAQAQAQPSPVQEEQPQDLSPPALPVRPRPQRDRVLSSSFIQYLALTKKRTHLPEEAGGSGSVRSAAPLPGPVEEETVKARRERGRVRTRLVSLVSRVSKKATQ